MSRRLAAILVADVVGYSRLIEADEADTLAALKVRRKAIVEPLVHAHSGRIVKFMGDGVLVEFASAVNAVSCAVDIQRRMEEANAGLTDNRRISLRIGINLGDVVVEGSDLFGDGINVAARLEALAEPGGICVSDTVQRQVKGKISEAFQDLGEQKLKNISEPIRAYRIDRKAAVALVTPYADKPSIAVLPFTNMSGDSQQAYYADGITEDIITELSRFSSLLVIARNSSFQYRDRALDMKKIGQELGARYLVEGSVRRLGGQIRITAQLIDAMTGNHLWADRYDRKMDDLFTVQDEVVRAVVTTAEHRIADSEAEHRRRKPPNSWVAYDHMLQARQCMAQYSTYLDAETHLRRAIESDQALAEAHARLAHVEMAKYWEDADQVHLEAALQSARKAISTGERDSSAHTAMALVSAFRGQFDLAFLHSDRALALNPNNVLAAVNRTVWQSMSGACEEALAALDLILERDPLPASWYWEARGIALFHLKRYREAIEVFRLAGDPQYWERGYIIAALALAGSVQEARQELVELRTLLPAITIGRIVKADPYNSDTVRNHYMDGLRKAGLAE
ncbi:adenylate/guanylate cyclase domain-containing protein [soil metagenome]